MVKPKKIAATKKRLFHKASPLIFKRAHTLRDRMTEAESVLWSRLCNKQLGVKFRRQHLLSNYIADFYCHELKLVIEIDGSIHKLKENKLLDAERQKNIEELGIKVIRFSNHEVFHEIKKVLGKIKSYIK